MDCIAGDVMRYLQDQHAFSNKKARIISIEVAVAPIPYIKPPVVNILGCQACNFITHEEP